MRVRVCVYVCVLYVYKELQYCRPVGHSSHDCNSIVLSRYGAPSFSPATSTDAGSVGKLTWDGTLTIRTVLKNVGKVAAAEVVQLYVHDRVASRVRPVRELKGFTKVQLAPGASQVVTFTLQRADVSFAALGATLIDADSAKLTVEPGMFDLWVASSSAAGISASFELLGAGAREEL